MRKHASDAEALMSQASHLPNSYLLLKAATTDIGMCVVCSRGAINACDRAAGNIAKQNTM